MIKKLFYIIIALATTTARAQYNNDNLEGTVHWHDDFGMWVVDIKMNNEISYSTIQADVSVDTTLFELDKTLYAFTDRIASKQAMGKVNYSHNLDAAIWDSKFMRMLISSSDNSIVLGNEGTVVYLGLNVKADADVDQSMTYPVNLTNIDLVNVEVVDGGTKVTGNYTQGVISDKTICCYDGNSIRPAIYGTISERELENFREMVATTPWAVEADLTNCTMEYVGRIAPDEDSYNFKERYNKNLLLYTNNRNQVGASNENVVVVSGNDDKEYSMESMTLYDSGKQFYASNEISASSISYDRTFVADKWYTLCLPFSLTTEQLAELQSQNVFQIEELGAFEDGILKFKTATEIKANRPYLIKTASDCSPFASVNSSVNIAASDVMDNIVIGDGTVYMYGSFSNQEITPKEGTAIYGFSTTSDSFIRVSGTAQLPPFRAYIEIPEASAAKLMLQHGNGEATGIEGIDKNNQYLSNKDIYTIEGILVKSKADSDDIKQLSSGVYLIGDKKIIIK